MSRGKMLKTLVQERLTVAAEEICELFERMIAEYEEEQCRFKERSQASPEPQDFTTLQIQSVRGGVHFPSSPDHFPNQQITGTPQIKKEPDEHSVTKKEEDSLLVCARGVPQPSAVCVRSKKHSLQQKQGDLRDGEACDEAISSETELSTEMTPVTGDDEELEPPNILSSAWMETGFDRSYYNPDTDEPQFPQDTDGPQCQEDIVAPHDKNDSSGPQYNQVQIRHHSTTTRSSILSIKNNSATKSTRTEIKKYRKKHQCTICRKTFRKEIGLKNHLRIHTHTEERPNSISNSNETFSPEEILSQARVHSGVHPFRCPICQKTFSYKASLDSHTRTHTVEKQFHCPVCKKAFNDKYYLSKHKRFHTGVKPFCCSICNKRFSLKCNLNTHMAIHSNKRPFTCSYCKKTYIRKEALDSHTRTHTGEKKFHCSVCKKSFSEKSNRNKHERLHTGEKPFSCSVCNKTFALKCSLTTHMVTHSNKRPFTCSYCEKTFTRKQLLESHTRTHTGEKPFICSVCGKTFAERSNLYRHKNTHADKKLFSCSVCNKSFRQKYTLITHGRMHTGEKPYNCSICKKAFIYKASLVSHTKTHR